ncbi:hypothetical protein AALO_G00017110 [Alosa alosa]|uniref:Uncharacterized protein n=1 Tax=Alosa alosa TaxID=278164 RepID=A0AAV6HHF6_9TELE|nr:hypothetical protein AALO_G00017110 [Alosa alosa]
MDRLLRLTTKCPVRLHPTQQGSLRNRRKRSTSTWRLRKQRRLLWPYRISSDAFRRKKSEVKEANKESRTEKEGKDQF